MADNSKHHHPLPPNSEEFGEYTFVVKLYVDDEHHLRGHITHAVSRHRRPLHRPEDILAFLEPYLDSLGVRLRSTSKLIIRLSRFPRRKSRSNRAAGESD